MALRSAPTPFCLSANPQIVSSGWGLTIIQVHHQALSSQPGDFNFMIGHGIRVPLKSPDVVEPHFSRGTIHESHIDALAVPVETNPCRVVAPLTKVDWILPLPPIFSRRWRIAVCPGGAVLGFVVLAYWIGAVPGTVGDHWDLCCVS